MFRIDYTVRKLGLINIVTSFVAIYSRWCSDLSPVVGQYSVSVNIRL